MLALDGGRAATRWQKRHAARKRQKLQKQHRAEAKAYKAKLLREAKADLKRRKIKWWANWERRVAAAKEAGLPPPSRAGQPHQLGINNPCVVDMTGRTFGRLTVVRSAPVSLTRKTSQRCRVWVVKCSCGSPEKLVNGTSLRQGNSRSCGCLHRERLRRMHKDKSKRHATLLAAPLSVQLAELRHRILLRKPIARRYSKLLSAVRRVMVAEEVRQGVRLNYKTRAGALRKSVGVGHTFGKRRKKPALH
jgi:hypothetical protein